MNRFVLGLLGAIVFLIAPLPVFAGSAALKEGEEATAPHGYVEFCKWYQQACNAVTLGEAKKFARITITADLRRVVEQVNRHENARIAPMNDGDLYGISEWWTYPAEAGDCEDYVLAKKRLLEQLGFPQSALRITVVLDEKGGGHAVLTIRTKRGDLVLDNRREAILSPSETGYTFLKWQSAQDPMRWVKLLDASTPIATGAN